VAVVGGGISGLATAWLLREQARGAGETVELSVFEASDVAGGYTRSERVDGYLCEIGPNGFLDNEPATLELVQLLGLRDRLVAARSDSARRYVYHSGALHLLPSGPLSFAGADVLSLRAKLRMALEPLIPAKRDASDESVFDFGRRRLGNDFARYLLGPMVSGVFAGDAQQLSLAAAFPKMAELEREHGGLFRAMWARRGRSRGGPAGPGGTLHTFAGGMGELTAAIASKLEGSLHLASPVEAIELGREAHRVRAGGQELEVEQLVLACPAHVTARLLRPIDAALAEQIAAIGYASVAVSCRGYRREQLGRPLDGFGVLAPRGEGIASLGTLCSDRIFDGQAPSGTRLLRTIVGGSQQPDLAALDDDALAQLVDADHRELFAAEGQAQLERVYRHPRAIAQYTIGHHERVAAVERFEQEQPGVYFTGAGYRGVAVNACIKDAFATVERMRAAPFSAARAPSRDRAEPSVGNPPGA
jgi:oxygen-dependent protoporphyrinogen oxidase